MNAIARLLAKNAVQGWKSSVLGVVILAMTGYTVYVNPALLISDEGQAGILTAVTGALALIGKPKKEPKTEEPKTEGGPKQ